MPETNYLADPRGLFTFPEFGDTEAAESASGFPAGTKFYHALLTQSGTNAPVATVLKNTLGGTVVWSYLSQGVYSGALTGAFTANKTFVFCGSGQTASDTWASNGTIAVARVEQDDAIIVTSGDASSPDDSRLFITPIEVIVYP